MFDTVEVHNNVDTYAHSDTGQCTVDIGIIDSGYTQKDQAFANITVHTQDSTSNVKCKLDTGAQSNVMPLRVFAQLFPDNMDSGKPVGLQDTQHRLSAYGGTTIKQYGQCQLQCTHQTQSVTLPFFVTDAAGYTMLGLKACVELNLVTLNCDMTCMSCTGDSDISTVTRQSSHPDPKHPSHCPYGAQTGDAKKDVVNREQAAFSLTEGDVGDLPGTYHVTMDSDAEPRVHPAHRVPEALREPFKQKLDWMVEHQIIRKVDIPTEWVNNVVIVSNANGDLRICLDPKDLNRWIKREHHYTPTLDDMLPRLSTAKVFSVLDARSGYWNVHLDEESQLLTTFNTPFGRYCFLRLPFGLVSSQDIFQKKMDIVLEGLPGAASISDDVLVWGDNDDEHDVNLYDTLKRSESNGVKYNLDKCVIKQPRVKFYGHYISDQGLEIDPDKVAAIHDMPEPTCVTELQSILGMVNYLARFTKDLASITAPLRDLTKKDTEFLWQPAQQKAFDTMKKTISSPTVLAFFDGKKPVVIQTDASTRGLGATLLQEGRPVAYASKSLTTTERNYSNIEREMLGVLFGLERFHHYAFGRKVVVETDHKPLESIFKKNVSQAPPRLQRMLLRIQPYDVDIQYKPGRDIPVADALSRAPIPGDEIPDLDIIVHEVTNVTESRLEQIRAGTAADPELTVLKQVIHDGWPMSRNQCPTEAQAYWSYRDELSVHNGVILKGMRVVIPKSMQLEVLDLLHAGHQGIEKCRLRARNCVFWNRINSDIDEMIKKCATCQHNQSSQQREPIMHMESDQPWKIVGTDLFHWDKKDYLLVIDYYSNFPVIRKLSTTSATSVINSLRAIFSEYGIPDSVISDNGPQYASAEFADFRARYGFRHTTSSPHYPEANGKAERYVGVVKKTLQKCLESGQDPHMAMLCIRTTPIGPKLPSPAELMFGRKVQSNLPAVNLADLDDCTKDDLRDLREHHDAPYNSRSRPLDELNPGNSVRVQDPVTKKWSPGIIKAKEPEPRSYLVQLSNGGIYRRNRKHIRHTGETVTLRREYGDEHEPMEQVHSPVKSPVRPPEHSPAHSPEKPPACSPRRLPDVSISSPLPPGRPPDVPRTRSGRAVVPPDRLNL